MNIPYIESEEIMTVAVIGSGNVATHLKNAFPDTINTILVNPRTLENLPSHSQVAVIAVKDSAVEEVARMVNGRSDIIAHTSGSVPMSVLQGQACGWGVFYPLQTFTKDVCLDYSEIPFFIEADSKETENILTSLARHISDNVYIAGSEQRKQLHLASVFACNFTNCLMGISQEILKKSDIDFRVMLPLLRQTISKLSALTPAQAQTGPAARKDYPVMNAHTEMLADNPDLQQIYRMLSDQIIKNINNELNKL